MTSQIKNEGQVTDAKKGSLLRFILFSAIGIVIFFVPIDATGQSPIVVLINFFKQLLGTNAKYIATIITAPLCITYVLAKVTKNEKLVKYHSNDGNLYAVLYFLALIFSIMVLTGTGPALIIDKNVGGLALSLASTVMLTTFIAGWLVIFLMKSGIVDFIGVLLEPVMRPLFKLPGEAAVNAVTAFVSAPAVGVYFTNKLYKDNIYTQKETIAVITNFSVCSIGFFGVLVSIGGITNMYSQVVLASILVTFIMGMIVIRIPIISWKKNVYLNGEQQTPALLKERNKRIGLVQRFQKATNIGVEKSSEMDLKAIVDNLFGAAKFTQKIVAFVIAVATLALLLAEHTPLFTILGQPMLAYLNLLGVPEAQQLAPSTIIGISDMILPVTLIANQGLTTASVFFITVLSTVQVIFFTGSATAMLELDVPLNVGELVLIFLIRTVIAIPIVLLITKLMLGF